MITYRPLTKGRFAIMCDQFIILVVRTEAEAQQITGQTEQAKMLAIAAQGPA